jgi:Protein of unknown function (DUF1488)
MTAECVAGEKENRSYSHQNGAASAPHPSLAVKGLPMALTQGGFRAYDFNRMVVLFTMMNDKTEVPCAISTDAMDRIEGSTRITPEQREQQFLRLRDRIEERASRKFLDVELEGNPPGVILRSIDFRPPLS